MVFALKHIEIEAIVVSLHRDLHVVEEEAFFVSTHCLEEFHVLNTAVEHGASVRCDHTVKKIESSFKSSLEHRS